VVPFFFSSRRRHTRFSRDWSSDVCSSDLCSFRQPDQETSKITLRLYVDDILRAEILEEGLYENFVWGKSIWGEAIWGFRNTITKIGRAACRERASHSCAHVVFSEASTDKR